MYENQQQQQSINQMPPVAGVLIWKGEIRQGVGRSSGNEWKSQDFAIEWQDGQYPQHAVFTLSGVDRVNGFKSIPIGALVEVLFNLDGREYTPQGGEPKWFGSLRAFRVRNLTQQSEQIFPNSSGQQHAQQGSMYQQASGQQRGGYPQPGNQQAPPPQQYRQQAAPAPEPDDDLPF